MRNMSLCHLYSGIVDSNHVDEILASFEESVSINADEVDTIDDYGVYIIELNEIDKELSLKIRALLKSKLEPLIYFIVPKTYSLMLFQLAFMLKSKTIITQRQDTDKVISKIKIDFKQHNENNLECILGKYLVKNQDFLLFRDEELIFASEQLLKDFDCSNLLDVEKKLLSQIDIDLLLGDDSVVTKSIIDKSQKQISFFIKSVTLSVEGEKVIFLEEYTQNEPECNELNFISSRTSYIELLKDKLLEKSISNKSFSIITIKIENLKKLNSEFDKTEMEYLLKEFLIYIESILDEKLTLAQFDMEFYVTLFEDIDFDNLKEKTQDFNLELSKYKSEHKFKPYVTLCAFDTDSLELNDILLTLENISLNKPSSDKINSENLVYVSNSHENMSESEIIDFQLNSTYMNSVEFKLQNIHKGLCINTSSKIIKKTKENVYITFEHLQGILMQNEKETVMQFSGNQKDIRARVKYVNIEERFAILENFEFLNANANEREYSRVTCSNRTPVVVSYLGATLHGELLDISINSMAVKTKFSTRVADLNSKDISLIFTLPIESHVDGFMKLTLNAKVLFVMCDEINCKVICNFYEDSANETIIMEYVYKRQKELILEVKKLLINSNLVK